MTRFFYGFVVTRHRAISSILLFGNWISIMLVLFCLALCSPYKGGGGGEKLVACLTVQILWFNVSPLVLLVPEAGSDL